MNNRYQEGYVNGHKKGMEDCEPEIARLRDEVERLNKWADGFSDAQLKERRLCEERIREMRPDENAADMIERLLAENKCLRLNLATDSREADALREELDRLRPEVERLTAERDQARDEQISAVNAMLKAERETKRLTISRDEWKRMYDEARPVEQEGK